MKTYVLFQEIKNPYVKTSMSRRWAVECENSEQALDVCLEINNCDTEYKNLHTKVSNQPPKGYRVIPYDTYMSEEWYHL